MRLKEYKDVYYEFSGNASDISRQLAFAGIAIIWIFRSVENPTKIPEPLLLPFAFMVSCLFFDILQYLAGTTVWGIFQWHEERKLQQENPDKQLSEIDEMELDSPTWLKHPQFICFMLKTAAIFLAYVWLGKYLWAIWCKS
jgi:hypothetical protein